MQQMEILGVRSAPAIGVREYACQTKKRRPEAPLLKLDLAKALRRLGFLFLHGTGIQALGIDVAIDEFDHGHRRVVAVAEAGLDDAGIAAMTVLVAGRQNVEQLLDLIDIAPLGAPLAAHGEPALLAERHELLDDRTQFLGLRQRGNDLLVLDQGGAHIGEHRAAMLGGAVEFAVNLAVTHETIPCLSCRDGSSDIPQVGCLRSPVSSVIPDDAKQRSGISRFRVHARACPGMTKISSDPRSAWRARRYSPAASPALPCRGADPSGPALP